MHISAQVDDALRVLVELARVTAHDDGGAGARAKAVAIANGLPVKFVENTLDEGTVLGTHTVAERP